MLYTFVRILINIIALNGTFLYAMEEITDLDGLYSIGTKYARKYFDEKKLHLFDGADGANQCHINALMIILNVDKKFDDLDINQQRFLTNNLLRSIPLGFDQNSGPHNMQVAFNIKFNSLLRRSLRSSKSQLIKNIISEIIQAKEIFFNSRNDVLWSECGFECKKIGKLNLPKFVGIDFFLKRIEQYNIPMVIKCEISYNLNKKIETFFIYQKKIISVSNNLDDFFLKYSLDKKSAVVVIEGGVLLRDINKPNKIACYIESLSKLDPVSLQLGIAASWTQKNQAEAFNTMSEEQKKRYNLFLENAKAMQGSCDVNHTFLINHMFPDILENAFARDYLVFNPRL